MKLTPRQKAFADYYIECGNASEAARRAGYSKKTAREIGADNLTKPHISKYISELMEQVSGARIAKAEEVLEFFTSVMRGEVKDQFGLDATLSDRIKAGEDLGKRYGLFSDKVKLEHTGKDGGPIKAESAVQIYLPANGRDSLGD